MTFCTAGAAQCIPGYFIIIARYFPLFRFFLYVYLKFRVNVLSTAVVMRCTTVFD